MKTPTASLLGLAATITSASAHSGHDHSDLSAPEFAWHHLVTGGFIGVASIAVAYLTYQAFRKRKETMAVTTRRDS